MQDGTCSIEDCDQPIKARGWCQAHYSRNRLYGSPLLGRTSPVARGSGLTACSMDGCTKRRKGGGMCSMHYERNRKYGKTDPPRRNGECALESCTRKESKLSGLCSNHLLETAPSGLCAFEVCGRPSKSKTEPLCQGHYAQRWAGRPLTPIRSRSEPGAALLRDAHGRKWCVDCTEWRPEGQFHSSVHYPDGLNIYCKQCGRYRHCISRYGITRTQLLALYETQDSRCRICGIHEDELGRYLSVDHDHAHCIKENGCPECVRGLLCMPCNSAIGMMYDSPERLEAAADYVRQWYASPVGVVLRAV